MDKQAFLQALRAKLAGLPQEDVERSIEFYGEMIDDRVEEGTSEEEAVRSLGTIEEIAAKILSEVPLPKLIGECVKERVRPRRTLKGWEILLIVLGAPLWLPLLIAALAVVVSVVISIYAVVFSLVISLAAVDLSLFACAIGGVAVAFTYSGPLVFFFIGAALCLIGCGIFLVFGVRALFCVTLVWGKNILRGIKSFLVKGGKTV